MSLLIILADTDIHIDSQTILVDTFLMNHVDLPPAVVTTLIPSLAQQLGTKK
jgi:hypothetical protein